jgi:hypothetical protein
VVVENVLNASAAALTAMSISSFVPAVICPITSSLAGLITSYVDLSDDFCHLPSINCPNFSYVILKFNLKLIIKN